MKLFLIGLLFTLPFLSAHAQTGKGDLSGMLVDSTGHPLEKASVSLLNAVDSSAESFVLTTEKGEFTIAGIKNGKYLLIISYLGYQPFVRSLDFTDDTHSFKLGKITLKSASVTLDAFTIEQAAPPLQIKGDTLEFNAGSFKTRPNAVVEELLKQIPGIQVEADGTITSEGETINQILVDGKPFFGNDPKIATKNLPADIIDKVQVYEKKSDQATFTGVDDGEGKKAINLKIKKDKKRGLFGKAEAGAGTEDRFAASANLFRFNNDQQISFVGGGNNTNQRNYTFRDVRRGGPSGSSDGNTTSWMGGVNYRDQWGDKVDVSGNYFYNYNRHKNIREQNTQYILPDTTYYKDQNQSGTSETMNHRLEMRIDYKIDSMNSVLFRPSMSYSTNSFDHSNTYQSNDLNKTPINAGGSYYSATTESPNFSGSLLWRHRFHKQGRTLSVSLRGGSDKNDAKGINRQQNTLYNAGIPTYDTIDQHFERNDDARNWGLRLAYTEPLSEDRSLELHIAHNASTSISEKNTYDQNPLNGKYDLKDSIYSNAFRNRYTNDQAGFNIQTRKESYDYTVGFNVRHNILDNYSISGDSSFNQQTYNYYPEARFNYTFSRTSRLRIDYQGSTTQPSIRQLQSVPDNTQSLRVLVGNPNLKPSFTHAINANYRNFNRETYRMFLTRLSFTTTANDIVNATAYQQGGKQVVHYENTNGNYALQGSVTAGFPIKESTNMLNTSTSFRYRRNASLIDDKKNYAGNLNLSEQLRFNYSYEELFDFRISGRVSYNKVRYTLQSSQNTDYFNYGGSLDFNINLPLHFTVQTDFRYSANTGLSRGYNQNIAMWNASVSKYLFKDQKGLLKFQALDLLHQQADISRNITAEYIQDVRTNVIPPYFMVSFTYFLNRFPGVEGDRRGSRRGFRSAPSSGGRSSWR